MANDEEEKLLRSVALQNSSAILLARQRAERELIQAKEQAEQLAAELGLAVRRALLGADVAKALTGIEPLPDLLQACVAAVVRHLDAALARIWTVSADGGVLELKASAGLYTHRDAHARVPIGSFKIGLIAQERRRHLSNDIANDPRVSDRSWAVREGLVGFAGHPLLVQGQLVGVMATFSRSTIPPETQEALASIADIVSLGIERRRMDALRAESEVRKASILDAAMDAIIVIDCDGRLTDFNPAAERIFRCKRDEAIGKELADILIPPAFRERHREGLRRYITTGKSDIIGKRIEISAMRPDGTEFPVELAIAPIALGGSLAFTGYLRDITERRRADAERADLLVREQSARASLATTLKSIGDAVIATDAAARVTFMNPVAETLTGWRLDDAVGQELRTVFQIVDESTRAEVENPAEKVTREGVVVGLANRTILIARDGKEIPIDHSGAPIRDSRGVLTGVVLVFRDVTNQRAEADRREFLVAATPALATVLDVRKTLVGLAQLSVPTLADWCGIDMVSSQGTRLEQIAVAHVDPTKVAMAEELGKRYPVSPDAKSGVPNVVRTGQSELYPEITDEMLVSGAVDDEHLRILRGLRLRSAMTVPLKARGRILGAITFIAAESGRRYTVDDLRFAEEFARRAAIAVDNAQLYEVAQSARRAADKANRAKDDFLATVSHELRTPLSNMLGWARLLRAGNISDEERDRALETIERNAVAQAQLIEDLLDVSRIVSGKLRLEVQSLEMVDVVSHAIGALRLASQAREIEIVAALDGRTESITGDPHRLQQVVWNLLSNAIKFTPRRGRIDLAVVRADANLEIIVKDNGRGISPELLPQVFDRFKQANGATTRSHGGLGLGLAISRHIVELHGGSLEAQSDGEGHGSTFTVRLPVSPIAHATPDSSQPPARAPASEAFEIRPELKNLRVLIVDDEKDGRDLLVAVLEKCGAAVTTAGSASEALESLRSRKPDVLLSDIGMPGEDGYELIRKIRALAQTEGANIPAAALTAFARTEDRRKAMDAGFDLHIPKPVEPAELVAVVANLTRFVARR